MDSKRTLLVHNGVDNIRGWTDDWYPNNMADVFDPVLVWYGGRGGFQTAAAFCVLCMLCCIWWLCCWWYQFTPLLRGAICSGTFLCFFFLFCTVAEGFEHFSTSIALLLFFWIHREMQNPYMQVYMRVAPLPSGYLLLCQSQQALKQQPWNRKDRRRVGRLNLGLSLY